MTKQTKDSSSSSCSSSSSDTDVPVFDHERLHVYQASLEFVAFVHQLIAGLDGIHRNARDQLIRSSQSIPLNIAEGNGKRPPNDRNRFFEIARGSAMESAATLDVLVRTNACNIEQVGEGKSLLARIVAMLYKMTQSRSYARESALKYEPECSEVDYDDEHDDDDELTTPRKLSES